MPNVKLYTKVCRCGTEFVTITSRRRWCALCISSKTARIARRSSGFPVYGVVAPGGHTFEQWLEVLRKQRHRCYYCGKLLNQSNRNREHKIPICRGGSDDISNVVAACRKCNEKKKDLTAEEFFEKQRQQAVARQQNSVDFYSKPSLFS
jgi:hypothetical protein